MKKTEFRRGEAGNIEVFEDGCAVFDYAPQAIARAVEEFARAGGHAPVPTFVALEADWLLRRSLFATASCYWNVWDEPVITLRPRVNDFVEEMMHKYGVWRYGEFIGWKNYLTEADESTATSHTAYIDGDHLAINLSEMSHDPDRNQRHWQRNGHHLLGQREGNVC